MAELLNDSIHMIQNLTHGKDLLRRFRDGINGEAARFHVEYVKEPQLWLTPSTMS